MSNLGEIRKNRNSFVPPKLQITAMMDMFTIIVFFLLFSFSERPDQIKLDGEIVLPESSAQMDYKNSIKLMVSDSMIRLDDKIIAKIENLEIQNYDAKDPKNSVLYQSLRQYRIKLDADIANNRDNSKVNAKVNSEILLAQDAQPSNQDQSLSTHILFFCDRSLPFKTVNEVIKTVAMAGFPNLQFAVTNK